MNIGIIARDDAGGLAAQSLEFAQNLPIAKTLLVKLGDKGRGPSFDYDWPECTVARGPHIDDAPGVMQFLDGLQAVLSIETFYGYEVIGIAASRGIPTVRYANPELYVDEGQSHIVLPTWWERERIPGATVIPQGVTRQKTARCRTEPAKTLLHFTTPAMMDRNGTQDFVAALNRCRESFRVVIVGPATYSYERSPKHEWIDVSDYSSDRFSHYSEDIDLLVLPRRYGGLCLPMLEAASFGIPTLTTDLHPQNKWFGPMALVETQNRNLIKMVGGDFYVYSTYVDKLAERLDYLASTSLANMSNEAMVVADQNEWRRIVPYWHQYFERITQ